MIAVLGLSVVFGSLERKELALIAGRHWTLDFTEGNFGGHPTATGWLAATAAKGTLVGSANLCAGTSDSDWDNGGSTSRSCTCTATWAACVA